MFLATMSALSERSRAVLRAVVVEFIESGEPVGSRTLADKHLRDISPATIRNVLAELEEAGFLFQPHTSAGRIPTEQGFRTFVDGLMDLPELPLPDEARIHALDELPPGQELLRESGKVLSELAGIASLVIASRGDARVLAQVHFIRAQDGRSLLAVLMFRDGTVETRFVADEPRTNDAELQRVHECLASEVIGHTLREVRDRFAASLDEHRLEIDEVSRRAFELAIQATEAVQDEPLVVIQGQERLIDQPDFGDVTRLRTLVHALREQKGLIGLLDRTIRARTVQVLVGREAGQLADGALSFVIAPFTEGGKPSGMVGVVGPTRMNYPRMVPLVSATAHAVSAAHDRAARAGLRRVVRRRKSGDRRY